MTPDWLVQPGIILFTENYEACVAFYRDRIGLPVLYDKGHLVTLGFGAGYLMIEKFGVAVPGGKSREQNPVTIRFNVADVEATAELLRARGIAIDVRRWDWGVTAAFHDPDGNLCELKDQADGFFAPAA